MIFHHLILGVFWLCYSFMHSMLAATGFKLFIKKKAGKFFRYYRLSYSIFAAVTLVLLFYYQFSFQSIQLINSEVIKYVALIFFAIPGMLIMITSILKYFKLLSGIRSLYIAEPAKELKIDGIHRYMRHPLYSGTLLFAWGIFFIFPLLNNFIAVFIITVYVLIGIKFEEEKLIMEFGESYKSYQIRVPMLVPHFKRGWFK